MIQIDDLVAKEEIFVTQPTNHPTKQPIKAPSRSLKNDFLLKTEKCQTSQGGTMPYRRQLEVNRWATGCLVN